MAVTLSQFVQQTIDSGLLTADEVAAVQLQAAPTDAEQLARALVQQKKLTPFQAQQIYAGKGASLSLGNYLVLDKLGQGGMGMVLKATHRRMKRLVALKVLSPKLTKTPELVARFQREVEAAARLSHPNIVAAHDADVAGDTYFLVMEYVSGRDLSSLVKSQGPLPPEQAVSCALQAARGLDYAHRQGVIHRDIKPANLLLDDHGTVKILDMGLARIEGETGAQAELTSTGAVMGTVDYMAPEQALNTKTADARSDIYSLGATLWYLLMGRPLFEGDSLMARLIAHREFSPPSLVGALPADGQGAAPAGLLVSLDSVLQRMLAKDPAARFQSMSDVISALESVLNGGVLATTGPSDDSRLLAFLTGSTSRSNAVGATPATAAQATVASVAPGTELEATFTTASAAQLTSSQLPKTDLHAQRLRNVVSPAAAEPRWWSDRRVRLGAAAALILLLATPLLWRPHKSATDSPPAAPPSAPGNSSSSADSDRAIRAALDWVRESGGTATVHAHGNVIQVDRITAPPIPPYTVTDIHLHDAFGLTREDLARLACLPAPFQLQLPKHLSDEHAAAALRGLPNVATAIAGNVDTTLTPAFGQGLGDHPLEYLILPWRTPQPGSLAALASLPKLNVLLLQRCVVSPAVLAEVARLPHLRMLNLESSNITDEHLAALTLPQPCHLSMFNTTVTAAGAIAFLKRHPHCTLEALAPDAQAEVDQWLAARTGNGVSNGSPAAAIAPKTPRLRNYSLAFDGATTFVHVPTLTRDDAGPGTLEVLVTPAREDAENYQTILAWHGKRPFSITQTRDRIGAQVAGVETTFSHGTPNNFVTAGRRLHLAAVWDGEHVHFFVDGRRSTAGETSFPGGLKTGGGGLVIGGNAVLPNDPAKSFAFAGVIESVRVSRVARYLEDYDPPTAYEADADTIALYRFDEGAGAVLRDSSGHGHHGEIIGAKWLPANPDSR